VRVAFIILLVCTTTILHGQSKKRSLFDSTGYMHLGKSRLSVYLQPSVDLVIIENELHQNLGLAWGATFNDNFTLGSYASLLINPHQFILIFPNNFNLNMIHGGLLLGYNKTLTDRVSLGIESRLGIGEIIISYNETGKSIAQQNIKVAQLGLCADYQILNFLKANFTLGYRHFSNVSFSEINQKDINSPFAQVSLKIGNFRKLGL
jgi:hypothetical protein